MDGPDPEACIGDASEQFVSINSTEPDDCVIRGAGLGTLPFM